MGKTELCVKKAKCKKPGDSDNVKISGGRIDLARLEVAGKGIFSLPSREA